MAKVTKLAAGTPAKTKQTVPVCSSLQALQATACPPKCKAFAVSNNGKVAYTYARTHGMAIARCGKTLGITAKVAKTATVTGLLADAASLPADQLAALLAQLQGKAIS